MFCHLHSWAWFAVGSCLGLASVPALAWHPEAHRGITTAAYTQLPSDLRGRFRSSLEEILREVSRIPPSSETGCEAPPLVSELVPLATAARVALRDEDPTAAAALGAFLRLTQDVLHPLQGVRDTSWSQPHRFCTDVAIPTLRSFAAPDLGVRLWPEMTTWAADAGPLAQRLAVPWANALVAGQDPTPLQRLAFQRAVMATRDLWVSLWTHAFPESSRVFLHANRRELQPGQRFQLQWSATRTLPDSVRMEWLRLADGARIDSGALALVGGRAMVQAPRTPGSYRLMARDGQDGSAWLTLTVRERSPVPLASIHPLDYVLPARSPQWPVTPWQQVRPWDLLATGRVVATADGQPDEGDVATLLIPGAFSHIILYLGRNDEGEAVGVELTPVGLSLDAEMSRAGHELRAVVLPEGETEEAPDTLFWPWLELDLHAHHWRWAGTYTEQDQAALWARREQLLAIIQQDMDARFPYQLEFTWSGNLLDRNLRMVDDGRLNGASCTDYWLSLFEEVAGVCIGGSRITAAEVIAYYREDPSGSRAPVPEEFNPFGVPLLVKDLLEMGYRPVDPPPHVFACDGRQEVGVAIPSRLIASPDLASAPWLARGGWWNNVARAGGAPGADWLHRLMAWLRDQAGDGPGIE